MPHNLVLEAININKRFGELQALDNVSIQVRKNSFHALLGENGAGKSTLVKCIMGYYHPDSGELLLNEHQQKILNPRQALEMGIGMVYQHFTLIPNMTVAENLVMARPKLPSIIDWKKELNTLTEKMQDMPFDIPLKANVNTLAAGEKQKVEIVKQLLLDAKILILDEPTSVLTPNEAIEVLGQIKLLTQTRDLSVIIITHKFSEVTNFADDVTVLRKGKLAGKASVANTTVTELAEMMVGREVITQSLVRNKQEPGKIVLEINELEVKDETGILAVNKLSATVHKGEILGIAGVSGNGQKQLVEAFSGQRKAESGEIVVNKSIYKATRQEIRKHSFHCLPEEPLKNACVPDMSVADNILLRRFDQAPFSFKGWLLNRKAFGRYADTLIDKFSIRTPNANNPIGNLSGGNVQRTVLARELSEHVDVLVVANPCFGLDFNAVSEIHQRLMDARNNGSAILLVSEDLDEIIEMSDRVCVMSQGKLVYETTPQQVDLNKLGQYMAGH